MGVRVGPSESSASLGESCGSRRHPISIRLLLHSLLNVATWLLLTGLLFGGIFGIVFASVTTFGRTFYGEPIENGLYEIPGLNDEPYSDRAVACVQSGRKYVPVQLSQLLQHQRQATPAKAYPSSGQDAYRVVSRQSFITDAKQYTSHCDALSASITAIFSACQQLGYNVTRDVLRVVDGINSEDVIAIAKTLPVLILPYWDEIVYARYAAPSYDGSACMFRTSGMFEDATDPTAVLWGVSRAVRENKTATWLGYPGGVWRHGWYEDPIVHMRWYSDVFSTQPNGSYGMTARRFDLLNYGNEIDCSTTKNACGGTVWRSRWNDELTADFITPWYHSIAISNGSRYGLFLYEDVYTFVTTSRYSLERLIANASLAVLLARWMALMIALYPTDTIGLAALTNAFSFHYLPLLLLPRLRSSLEGFWTSGCVFDGDQTAMENSWVTIYPAIGEVVLLYFSVLNLAAKILRRRMTDVLFGPTLLFLVLLHRYREITANLKLMDGDRRVSAEMSAEEADAASVIDYFVTDLAFRVGGRVKTIFAIKLIVLGVNIVPLLIFGRVVDTRAREHTNLLRIENALSICFASNGGLGSVAPPIVFSRGVPVLRPYELVLCGYVVVGSMRTIPKLVSVVDWFVLLAARCTPRAVHLRALLYDVDTRTREGERAAEVSSEPRLVAVDDSSLVGVGVMHISAYAFH